MSSPGASNAADLGLCEAAAALAAGRLSPIELTEACLDRVAALNGGPPTFDGAPDAVNAWVRLYPEAALEQATAGAQRRAREGGQAPPLCGVPLAVKDLYGVAGLPLTASSAVLDDHVAGADATVWSRLEAAGMVLLGHTHTHEFAAGGTTDQVGNPWALDRVVGGSSGGSAAALAARMVPAALGSDTCGSLRIPSACCGTSAIKPTRGRLPLDGVIPLSYTLDHPGPMARSVADCALLLGAMDGDGAGDGPGSPGFALDARPGPGPLAGLRIACTDRLDGLDVEPAVAEAFEEAQAACAALGAELVSRPAPAALRWDDLTRILLSDAWAYHARFADRHDRYRPAIAEFMEAARTFTDAQAYIHAQQRRLRLTAEWERWFAHEAVDLVLEPTLILTPPARGEGYERGHAGGAGDPMIALTALWDMTGTPVVALPVTWQAGISLIAPSGGEAVAIQAGIDLQEHRLAPPGPPPILTASGAATRAAPDALARNLP